MSSIVYSGGTIVNNTFSTTTGTRAEIVSNLGTQLVNAGWSSIGGGVYKSATTASPKSNSIRVKLTDPGSGNCATVNIQNDAGDRVSNFLYLLPGAGKVYRVIACQYNFFCFTAGASAVREFVCGGTMHTPDHLNGVVTGSLGWLQGNSTGDGDGTSNRQCFRTQLTCAGSSGGRNCMIRNGAVLSIENGDNAASQNLLTAVNPRPGMLTSYRWSDDSIGTQEALLCFGIASNADEAKRQGLIHNCLLNSDAYAADTIPTEAYDGHTWFAITNNNIGAGAQYARGTLFVAIT